MYVEYSYITKFNNRNIIYIITKIQSLESDRIGNEHDKLWN